MLSGEFMFSEPEFDIELSDFCWVNADIGMMPNLAQKYCIILQISSFLRNLYFYDFFSVDFNS
jgi:hypothetical protein